jgi:hypothetical protein
VGRSAGRSGVANDRSWTSRELRVEYVTPHIHERLRVVGLGSAAEIDVVSPYVLPHVDAGSLKSLPAMKQDAVSPLKHCFRHATLP